jgi:hypothetical protein
MCARLLLLLCRAKCAMRSGKCTSTQTHASLPVTMLLSLTGCFRQCAQATTAALRIIALTPPGMPPHQEQQGHAS